MMQTDELWYVLEQYKSVENTSGPKRSHSSEVLETSNAPTKERERERDPAAARSGKTVLRKSS
jgi:hypothetical protein